MIKKKKTAYKDRAPKPVEELVANGKEFNRVRTDFLRVDLETALTFAGIALQTDDAAKMQRNRRNAREAYDTIRRLAKGVDVTRDDAQDLSDGLARLRSELQTLGETF